MTECCLSSCAAADDCFGVSAPAAGAGELLEVAAAAVSTLACASSSGGSACTRLTLSRFVLALRLAWRGAGERGGAPSVARCFFDCPPVAVAGMEIRAGGVGTSGEAALGAMAWLSGGDEAGFVVATSESSAPCASAAGLEARCFGSILRFFCALTRDGLLGAAGVSLDAAAAADDDAEVS